MDVFIAYDHRDELAVQRFKTTLGWLGYDVFSDADLMAGQDWAQKLMETIKGARCVLALWSKQSISSDYVKFEAILALAQDKLISVQIEEDQLPEVLRRFQAINLARWNHDISTSASEELFEALKRATGKDPNRKRWLQMTGQTAAPAVNSKPRSRALPLMAAAVVGMVLLGGGVATYAYLARIDAAPAAPTPPPPPPPPPVPPRPAPLIQDGTITLAELERFGLGEVGRRLAGRLGEDGAARLKALAGEQDAAATLEACIASLTGIPGFSLDEAPDFCAASAAQSHPAARYLTWNKRETLGVPPRDARANLVAAAEADWAPALQDLANYYRNGTEGFERNDARARALLERSAARGNPYSMLDLSNYYLLEGSEADRRQAAEYLTQIMQDADFSDLCGRARGLLLRLQASAPRCQRR